MNRIVAEADGLREDALALAEADAEAFRAVAQAYQLPRETEAERQDRSASISSALAGAARPPADVVRTALLVTSLAEELLPAGNRNMITDLAAAAVAARAAAVTARLFIEINLKGITDQVLLDEFAATAAAADTVVARAEADRRGGPRGGQPVSSRPEGTVERPGGAGAVRARAGGGDPGGDGGPGGRAHRRGPAAAAGGGHGHRRRGQRLVRPVAGAVGGQGRHRLRGHRFGA